MNKLILATTVVMFSLSMASTAFADGANGEGKGFENSGNGNACVNAGGGNGGEFDCGRSETRLDVDPGNSEKNQAKEPDRPACPPPPLLCE